MEAVYIYIYIYVYIYICIYIYMYIYIYIWGLCKENPIPKIAGYKAQETLHFRYLKLLSSAAIVLTAPRVIQMTSNHQLSTRSRKIRNRKHKTISRLR